MLAQASTRIDVIAIAIVLVLVPAIVGSFARALALVPLVSMLLYFAHAKEPRALGVVSTTLVLASELLMMSRTGC